MHQDFCTVRISNSHTPQYAPLLQKSLTFDSFQVPIPPQLAISFKPTATSEPMPTPPQTPPLLSHSPNVTPCTSAEPSPAPPLSMLPSPETELKPVRPSRTSTPKSEREETHVRRPANPFILFACEYRKMHKDENKNNRELSKEAGSLWKIMTDTDKSIWKTRAAAVKEKHTKDHPGYRYQPRRRETPRRPHRPSDSQNQTGPSVIVLPPTPVSMPRKSAVGPKRTTRKIPSFKEDEDTVVDRSILNSPTRRITKTDARPRDFTELPLVHTPYMGSELALPPLTLPQPASSTGPIAGPSSTATQLPYRTSNAAVSYLAQPWMDFPQERWNNMPLSFPDLVPAGWDQDVPPSHQFMFGTGADEADLQASMAGNDDDSTFFNHCRRPIFADPCGAISNGRSSPGPFRSFLDNNGSSNGA